MNNDIHWARLWALALLLVCMAGSVLIIRINPLDIALVYLALLIGVMVAGLMTHVWGGLGASVLGAFAVVLISQYAGIYPRENRLFNVASELIFFLLAGPFAGVLSVSLERMQARSDHWLALADERTVHDSVLGMLKIKWGRIRLDEELRRARLFERPLALAVLQVLPQNDSSRPARLASLQALGRIARAATSPPAVIAHAGGDRVMVILPEHTIEQARKVLDVLADRVDHEAFFPPSSGGLGQPLKEWGQWSSGLVCCDEGTESADDLYARAVLAQQAAAVGDLKDGAPSDV